MIAPAAIAIAQVVLWHAYRADEKRGLEEAVAAWNRAHPEAEVVPQAVPWGSFSYKLEAAIPRDHGPDCFLFAHEQLGEWSRAHLVAPLPDADLDPAQFLPGTVAPLREAGALWGQPVAFKAVALYYRTDLARGPPRTTDELARACAALGDPRSNGGRYCLAYEAGSFYHHAAWLHGEGGSIFDASGRPRLDTPEGVRALGFVRSLAERRFVPDEINATLVSELFNGGRAAFAIAGPDFAGQIPPGTPWAVATLPTMSDSGQPARALLTVEAGFLSPRAHHPAEARAFLRWLAGPEGALIRATVGRQPVCARAPWQDPRVAGDATLAAFRAQLDATVPMSNAPAMRAVWEPAQQALRRVLRGAAEPEAALAEADRQIAIALRPRPPSVSPLPYLVGGGLLALAGAFALRRRARAIEGPVDRGAYRYLAPAALAMVALVFVPFVVGAGMSLFENDPGGWRFVGFAHFANLLGSRDQPIGDPLSFWFTLTVTALWTVANVALHVTIGVALALLLRRPWLKLRGIYRTLLIVPWAVPNYITALLWKGMFHRQFGAVNALLALLHIAPVAWFSRFWTAFTANLATNVWLGFPFMMVVTLGALTRIPQDLEEAAVLDGASRFQLYRRVILPLLRPQLLPSVVLGAVWTFNMFNVVFLVSGGEPDGATEILVSQAYRWAFNRGHRYGYAAAFAVLIVIVLWGQSVLARRVAPPEGEGA